MSNRIALGELTAADLPELQGLLQAMQQALKPAKDAEIVVELEKLFTHYPQAELPDNAMKSRWRDWLADLGDVPLDALRAACRDWRQSAERWAPTPGQLLDKLKVYTGPRDLGARTAQYAIRLIEEQAA